MRERMSAVGRMSAERRRRDTNAPSDRVKVPILDRSFFLLFPSAMLGVEKRQERTL